MQLCKHTVTLLDDLHFGLFQWCLRVHILERYKKALILKQRKGEKEVDNAKSNEPNILMNTSKYSTFKCPENVMICL